MRQYFPIQPSSWSFESQQIPTNICFHLFVTKEKLRCFLFAWFVVFISSQLIIFSVIWSFQSHLNSNAQQTAQLKTAELKSWHRFGMCAIKSDIIEISRGWSVKVKKNVRNNHEREPANGNQWPKLVRMWQNREKKSVFFRLLYFLLEYLTKKYEHGAWCKA